MDQGLLTIEQLADLTLEDRTAIVAPLDEFSRERGFVWRPQTLALALRDQNGAIFGGLIAEVHWGWLRVEILAVAEPYRGRGWGRALATRAESLGIAAGCHHAWVDTFSFQSRPFYERLGYRVFGALPDYPRGETRFFLSKALDDPASRRAE